VHRRRHPKQRRKYQAGQPVETLSHGTLISDLLLLHAFAHPRRGRPPAFSRRRPRMPAPHVEPDQGMNRHRFEIPSAVESADLKQSEKTSRPPRSKSYHQFAPLTIGEASTEGDSDLSFLKNLNSFSVMLLFSLRQTTAIAD
jgi:hypothetical protein